MSKKLGRITTVGKDANGIAYAWPQGNEIATWRALARRGAAVEESGICEGCKSHKPGHRVPVFRVVDADKVAELTA